MVPDSQWGGGVTFGAGVPEADVSVGAARRQPPTERRVGDAVEHLAARLRNTSHQSSVGPSPRLPWRLGPVFAYAKGVHVFGPSVQTW